MLRLQCGKTTRYQGETKGTKGRLRVNRKQWLAGRGFGAVAALILGASQSCGGRNVADQGGNEVKCGPFTTDCGGMCIDLDHDPSHCGACQHACAPGEVCSDGACGLTCLGGSTLCGNACVDLDHDPSHCGSCDTACPAGVACSNGACTVSCAPPLVSCNGTCVDTTSNPAHCGACQHSCGANEVCSVGQCKSACDTGLTPCGGSCIDTDKDHDHCGSCVTACGALEQCVAGACACASGTLDCGGTCIDPMDDPANCGACGNACGALEQCMGGACTCAAGSLDCGGACINPMDDPANCGACGNACGAGKACSAGTCVAVGSDWNMLGHDERHSGFNPGETGKPPLVLSWTAPLSSSALSPAVISAGRVFVTASTYFQNQAPLWALSVADGSIAWNYNFGSVFGVGHPSVVDGKVYLGQCNHTPGTFLWKFDATTGSVVWNVPFSAQWENYWAPIVAGNGVYFNGGYYGGLYGVDKGTGGQLFFNDQLEQYDQWSPAYFQGMVYTFVEGNLRAHDPTTGAIVWTLSVNWNWQGWSVGSAPIFSDKLGYFISPPNLYAVDPSTHALAWTANGTYEGVPAVANDIVFGISNGALDARNALTGTLLWIFGGDGALHYPPVIAAGHVYVSSTDHVYAVDIATNTKAWEGTEGGWLSIGAGHLFVASSKGTLSAYALTP